MANEKTTITISRKISAQLMRVKKWMIRQRGEPVSWDDVMKYFIKLHKKEMRNAAKRKKERPSYIGGCYDTGGSL